MANKITGDLSENEPDIAG